MKKKFFFGLISFFVHIACSAVNQSGCPDYDRLAFSADLLVWTTQEAGMDNWGQVYNSGTTVGNILDVPFGFDTGLKLGLGICLESYDRWDLQLYYTRFCPQKNNNCTAPSGGHINSAFIGNYFASPSTLGYSYSSSSIQWDVFFNIFDLELGKRFCVSKTISVRPFIGIKGGWIHQTLDTTWNNPTNASSFTNATENVTNNFWGIGPSIGFNTTWELCSYERIRFNLLGDVSGALLWGHWTFSDVYQNNKPQLISIDVPNINGAASTFRTFMGLGWEGDFSDDQIHYTVRLGYELQFWLDQLQFYSFDTGRLNTTLIVQGGVFDLSIYF